MKILLSLSTILYFSLISAITAAEPVEIKLWPAGEGGDGAQDVALFLHLPNPEKEQQSAVVICPGGGYGGVVMSYEGNEVAQWFAEQGVLAVVLKYRVAPHQHPGPMHDVQRAIQFVRSNADKYRIQPKKIGVVGFSAGGHLAATAGTKILEGKPESDNIIERASSRPDFMILAYPVISMKDGVTHKGSKHNLLGPNPSADLVESMSLETQVTSATPPTFIFQTDQDTTVPAENSVLFYSSLRKAGVPAEFHVYAEGPHGVGLNRHEASLTWPSLLQIWLQHRDLLK